MVAPAYWKKKLEHQSKDEDDDEFILEQIYTDSPEDRSLFYDYCFVPSEKFQVYIHPEALKNAYEHARRGLTKNKEIAGVLIGSLFVDREKNVEFIEVVNTLQAQTLQSSSVDVAIPASEWSRLTTFVEESPRYRAKWGIVGWYHSHPNMSAFMSATDQDTQSRHFNKKGQVAIVLGVGNGYSEVKCFDHNSKEINLYYYPETENDRLRIASLSISPRRSDVGQDRPVHLYGTVENNITVLDAAISMIFQNCSSETGNIDLLDSIYLKGHIRGYDKWFPNLFLAISYFVQGQDGETSTFENQPNEFSKLAFNVGRLNHDIMIQYLQRIKMILEKHYEEHAFLESAEIESALNQCENLLQRYPPA